MCSGNGSGQPADSKPASACADIVVSGAAIVEDNSSFVCFGVVYLVSILNVLDLSNFGLKWDSQLDCQ